MTFRELQKLVSKRYCINAALANETASDLIKDELQDYKNMTPRQINTVLTVLDKKEY